MRILDRYLLGLFLKIFAVCVFGVPLVFIVIDLTDIRISQTAADLVTVTFEQSYESDSRADRMLKSLTLGLGDGDWLILKEESRPLG